MIPLSCSNCWHNPLQNDAVGLPVGYCTLHGRVLHEADALTCGHQKRKDLPIDSARAAMKRHEAEFSADEIVYIRSRRKANGAASKAPGDVIVVATDEVGEVVTDWSAGAKVESLAQLNRIPGARADLAMTSLSRAYVSWCQKQTSGHWTSGIHLLRWTLRRLAEEPVLQVSDLRGAGRLALPRQMELAQWSVVMMRLLFVSDMGRYAKPHGDGVAALDGFADRAAGHSDLSLAELLAWLGESGRRIAQKALPEARYRALAAQLRKREGKVGED